MQIGLLKAGIQQTDVAVQLSVTSATIHNACTLRTHNKRIQDYIASILGESAEDLWGTHYAPIWYQNKKNKDITVGELPTDVLPGQPETGR